MQESRGSSEAVYLDIALVNLEPESSVLGSEVKYFVFEYGCLAVAFLKMVHQNGEPFALNEQRIVLLDQPLHDNRGSDVFCHGREGVFRP